MRTTDGEAFLVPGEERKKGRTARRTDNPHTREAKLGCVFTQTTRVSVDERCTFVLQALADRNVLTICYS